MSKSEQKLLDFYKTSHFNLTKLNHELWEFVMKNPDIPFKVKGDFHALWKDRIEMMIEKDDEIINS